MYGLGNQKFCFFQIYKLLYEKTKNVYNTDPVIQNHLLFLNMVRLTL